jgi:hypothetical protein
MQQTSKADFLASTLFLRCHLPIFVPKYLSPPEKIPSSSRFVIVRLPQPYYEDYRMAEVLTVVFDQPAALHVRHKAHHPEPDQAYWTAQHTADNDLYLQYDAPDVGTILIGSTSFPVRPNGSRHLRIIYDRVTQNENSTDTTGSVLGSTPHWTMWMSIVYVYSVYESTDAKSVSNYAAQFANFLQPVLAYLQPGNRPHPAAPHTTPGSGLGHGHIILNTLDFSIREGTGFKPLGQLSLENWKAKTEELDAILGVIGSADEAEEKEQIGGEEKCN